MGTGSRREDGEGQEEAEGFVSNTKSSIQKANNVSLAAMASGTRKECVRVCVFSMRDIPQLGREMVTRPRPLS
jgi:hypothetical protein